MPGLGSQSSFNCMIRPFSLARYRQHYSHTFCLSQKLLHFVLKLSCLPMELLFTSSQGMAQLPHIANFYITCLLFLLPIPASLFVQTVPSFQVLQLHQLGQCNHFLVSQSSLWLLPRLPCLVMSLSIIFLLLFSLFLLLRSLNSSFSIASYTSFISLLSLRSFLVQMRGS